MKYNKILAGVTAFLMMVSAMPMQNLGLSVFDSVISANAVDSEISYEGSCGENGDDVNYVLYEDGTLIISGNGAIREMAFDGYEASHWQDDIESVIIENGITSIGINTFHNCLALKSVIIPNSVTSIGESSFWACDFLSSIELPCRFTENEDIYFQNLQNLKKEGITYTHTFTSETTDYLKSGATCTDAAVYFKSCAACGTVSDTETFTYGEPLGHKDEDKNGYCDACDIVTAVKMKGAKLVLDGTLKLKTYVALPDEIIEASDVEMIFSIENKENPIVFKAQLDRNNTEMIDSKQYYVFECDVPAKNMYSEITAKIVADGEETVINTNGLSVEKYANQVKNDKTEYGALIDTMLAYGKAAEAYFNGETVDDMSEYYEAVKSATASDISDMGDDYYGSSLILEENVIVRNYYTANADGRTEKNGFFYEEESVDPTQYKREDKYSVNDYIYKVLTKESEDDNLKNLCVFLYNYGVEAAKIGG